MMINGEADFLTRVFFHEIRIQDADHWPDSHFPVSSELKKNVNDDYFCGKIQT